MVCIGAVLILVRGGGGGGGEGGLGISSVVILEVSRYRFSGNIGGR